MPRVISPDTHNPAAQASAFKLVRLLRSAYPYIGELFTGDSPSTLAQASLLEYLSWVINPAESHMKDEERVLAKSNPNIKGTIQWIDYVNTLPSEQCSPEDKRMIFEQIKVIASTYPGGVWNDSEQHWSINKFYNKGTCSDDMMMTPPAEALNLVCTALFDESRYLTEEGEWGHDLDLRITTTYLHFLSLRMETNAGLLKKCSAGLQHDVLYFLNGSYLDKGAEEVGMPVELLMDTDSFLMGSLSSFVANCITKNSGEETNAMVLAWMDSGMNPGADHPLVVWLRKRYASAAADADSGWKRACSEYVSLRCEAFGLNPAQCPIAGFVDELPSIPVVVSQDTILPLVSEIMRMGVLAIPETHDSAWGPDSIYHLVDRRNQALESFKSRLKLEPDMIRLHAESIKDLFSALACVDSLCRYRDLSILIGAEDQRFQNARGNLKTLLLEYFNAYSPDTQIPAASFDRVRSAYFAAERVFLEQSNADFIKNFFALMGDGEPQTFSAIWARLVALRHEMSAPHPLILSDAALREWRRQSESMSADGQTMIDVTPYAINRLLLHGMLVPMRDWSPLYCEYLALLTNWLLRPLEPGEGLLRQVKESYPPYLLVNLLFMRLMKGANFDEALKERLFQLVQEESPHRLSYGASLFVSFLALPQAELSEAQKTLMLTAVEGQLGNLTRDGGELYCLLSLSASQLSEAQKTLVLTAVAGQLGTMIKNGQDLSNLFSLPTSQLSEAQRGMIWTAVEGQLGTLIKNGFDLHALFKLSAEQLSEAQRTIILGQLGTLIKNGGELHYLFSLSTLELSEAQRGMILTAVQGQLGTLIKNGGDLYHLFSLSTEQLSEAQRAMILTAVEGQLGTLIKNDDELYAFLFNLSPEQLSEAQRAMILTAKNGTHGLGLNPGGFFNRGNTRPEIVTADENKVMLMLR